MKRGCIFAVRDFLLRFHCGAVPGRVLLGLALFAGADGSRIFPGARLLARVTYLPPRKLTAAIQYWLNLKILVLVKPGRPKHAAEYRIDLSQLDSTAETSASQDSIPQRKRDEGNSIPQRNQDGQSTRFHGVHALDSAPESQETVKRQKQEKRTTTPLASLAVVAARRNHVEEQFSEEVYLTLLAFEEHRKKLRAPMSERALELVLKKLARFRAEGMDPIEVLEQSIMNGWVGIFPTRRERGSHDREQRGKPTATELAIQNAKALGLDRGAD